MAIALEFQFLIRSTGRSQVSDYGEIADSGRDMEVWKTAQSDLKQRSFLVRNESYALSIDWSSLARYHKRDFAVTNFIFEDGGKYVAQRIEKVRYPRSFIKIPIVIKSNAIKNRSSADYLSGSIIETAIYDVFFIVNLASPGSCDFSRSELRLDKKQEREISLSAFVFECSCLDRAKKGWPEIRVLPLKKVIDWFFLVRRGASQLPKNAAERAIFAMWHLSKGEIDPTSVIWIFYALESLLQTRVGESFSLLVKRLVLLLEMDLEAGKVLKKKMRALYDVRSALVHGGFEVMHPLNDDGLDKDAGEVFGDIVECVVYGGALIVAVLQKMVEKNWIDLQFEEVLAGKSPEMSTTARISQSAPSQTRR